MRPLLEIAGGPGQRWGLIIDEGLIVAVEMIRRPLMDKAGVETGFETVWQPLNRMPPKLIEYMGVFLAQHEPWLRPVGMPVSQEEYLRIRQKTSNRVRKGEDAKPALVVVDQAEEAGAADAAGAAAVDPGNGAEAATGGAGTVKGE